MFLTSYSLPSPVEFGRDDEAGASVRNRERTRSVGQSDRRTVGQSDSRTVGGLWSSVLPPTFLLDNVPQNDLSPGRTHEDRTVRTSGRNTPELRRV